MAEIDNVRYQAQVIEDLNSCRKTCKGPAVGSKGLGSKRQSAGLSRSDTK